MTPERRHQLHVLRAQAGDRAALGALFADLQAPLHAYLRGLVGRRALADDILQDVFVAIHRHLRGLRDPTRFRAWAHRIATREAFHHLRRERRWTDIPEDPAAPDPEPFDPALNDRLLALVDALPPASRAVVLLHCLQDLTLHEAADALGVPLGTAKSRLAYGLALLRRQLIQETPP